MKRVVICFLTLMIMIMPAVAVMENGMLRIDFLDVGKADAIIIRTDTETVLIDTGTQKSGKKVVKKLIDLGCESVDLMIITHYDKDHVGGADRIIKALPVNLVFVPDYDSDTKQTMQFLEAVEEYSVPCRRLVENTQLSIGSLRFDIDVSDTAEYKKDLDNNMSLVVSLTYGTVSFLFTGDVENPRLRELLDQGIGHSDVLKVPHHGGWEKLSSAFFNAVSPVHAVITSDEENPEDQVVVDALKKTGATVWLTREGNVVCLSDGESIQFSYE